MNENKEIQTFRDVPVDWEALEDAFENNAPEVHSYLHLQTGEVLRVVDGVADPQMHARIASDSSYLRIEPVSSREQYRWMERFIPTVADLDLRQRLAQSIDGKGAFRRFKDVLMNQTTDREAWFAFRGERLRTFMEAWLNAHSIHPIGRPPTSLLPTEAEVTTGEARGEVRLAEPEPPESMTALAEDAVKSSRRGRTPEMIRQQLKEIVEVLGSRDLDVLHSFAEFLKSRRAARSFAHHHEHMREERTLESRPLLQDTEPAGGIRGKTETR